MDVAELAEAFKDQSLQPATHAQLMQRMQELMGQGMDVSSLFPHIVSSASTRDIPLKKAAFAFLAHYGPVNEELCFLSINTLLQDCADLDPIIRSLALKTLCSLGQRSVLRFMLQPLNKAFQDKNAHVRKTAVMACISLFHLDPTFVLESEIVDKLYGMIRDRDAQVVVNAILALEAILVDEGGIVINQSIAGYLLKRYKDWNAGQLQVILGVLCRYKPKTSDEIYEIMNDVDDGLQHQSQAVQMATLRLFIWLCQDLNEIQEDVQKTIEETLIKHLESPIPGLVHASLCHLALMVETTGKLQHGTKEHISALFCRLEDPVPIQLQKLGLCTTVARSLTTTTTSNNNSTLLASILDHLCQVSSLREVANLSSQSPQKHDRHFIASQVQVACKAIESIGVIGSQFSQPSSQDHHHQRQYPSEQAAAPTSNIPTGQTEDSRGTVRNNSKNDEDATKSCINRLFRLLILFSNMEHLLEDPKKGSKKEQKRVDINSTSDTVKKQKKPIKKDDASIADGWMHSRVMTDLNLEDSQVALILSTILLAIDTCWQKQFSAHRRLEASHSSACASFVNIATTAAATTTPATHTLRNYEGVFEALQIKALGILLLRHLDQSELDRLAKTKKPLRFQYSQDDQNATDGSYTVGTSATNETRSSGSISRLARISGIRMLLMEESVHQLALQKQQQQQQQQQQQFRASVLLSSTSGVVNGNKDDDNNDPEAVKKAQSIRATAASAASAASTASAVSATSVALDMRKQYVLLLQQQVQELVQSIDTTQKRTTTTTLTSRSDNESTLLRKRAEHIAVLQLACHLVAYSIDHDELSGQDQVWGSKTQSTSEDEMKRDEGSKMTERINLFKRRLDILALAIDQLIPAVSLSPSSSTTKDFNNNNNNSNNAYLVTFDNSQSSSSSSSNNNFNVPAVEQHHGMTAVDSDFQLNHPVDTVSRDVADRARLIEALFLMPLLSTISSSVSSSTSSLLAPEFPDSTPVRTISPRNQFDSVIFKSEKYLWIVKDKFAAQFGVQGSGWNDNDLHHRTGHADTDTDAAAATATAAAEAYNVDQLLFKDWRFQIGFNTLAVTRR
ncbi:AP-4 complex subunit beta-1 [Mortierella claussenii]|nr:AP-4 complex subunit beta-1 [Mortierella claussenii]